MQIRPLVIAVMLAVLGGIPLIAQACPLPENQTPILHDKVPRLALGMIAAEVEITTDVRSNARPPLEARIISMIRGKYAGSRMRINPQVISSCDGFPYPGQRGIVVGRVLSSSKDVLVIDPVRAPSAYELRLQTKKSSLTVY